MWAAARTGLPKRSALETSALLVPGAVVSLGGVGNLERFRRLFASVGADRILEAPQAGESRAATTSPRSRPPGCLCLPAACSPVSGTLDRLTPPWVAHDYAAAHGFAASIERLDIASAGHFDLVTPGTTAWTLVRDRILLEVARR